MERHLREIGPRTPGRPKGGSARQKGAERNRRYLVHEQGKQFQGRGVGPMHIFQDKEDRTLRCQLQQHGEQDFVRLLPLVRWVFWRKLQGWIPISREGKRQQRRQQGHGLLLRQPILPERLGELVQLRVRRGVGLPWEEARKQLDDWVQGTMLVVRQAAAFQQRMWLTGDLLL